MKTNKKEDKIFVRLDRGEEIIEKLEELREKYDIKNGFFQGIGALGKVKLGNYNVENQEYKEKEFEGSFEVSNFAGNIGPDKIHAHITLGDRDFKAKAGHCSYGEVSGTFEIVIFLSERPKLKHKYDEKTGLDVLDLF